MWKASVIFVAVTSVGWAAPPKVLEELQPHYEKTYEWSIRERLLYFAKLFETTPATVEDITGEGEEGKYDKDPLYRLDLMNCVTYVESVLAMAYYPDLEDFVDLGLNDIRYSEVTISYLSRNHFISADWIPRLQERGFIEEFTWTVAKNGGVADKMQMAEKTIRKSAWYASKDVSAIQGQPELSEDEKTELLAALKEEGSKLEDVEVELPYLGWDALYAEDGASRREVFDAIPDGSVISIVGHLPADISEKLGWDVNVRHLGFAVRDEAGQLHLWHASTGGPEETHTVQSALLEDYLKRLKESRLGVNIQRLP